MTKLGEWLIRKIFKLAYGVPKCAHCGKLLDSAYVAKALKLSDFLTSAETMWFCSKEHLLLFWGAGR
jgi:uncharacterized protein (UPF0212 family)